MCQFFTSFPFFSIVPLMWPNDAKYSATQGKWDDDPDGIFFAHPNIFPNFWDRNYLINPNRYLALSARLNLQGPITKKLIFFPSYFPAGKRAARDLVDLQESATRGED